MKWGYYKMTNYEAIIKNSNRPYQKKYRLERNVNNKGFQVVCDNHLQLGGLSKHTEYLTAPMLYSEALSLMIKYQIDEDCITGYFHNINKVDLLLTLISKYGIVYHDYIIEQINIAYKG